MSFTVRYTRVARAELLRLYKFLLGKDVGAARRARNAIIKATTVLREFPFSCRKADPAHPFLRELVIPFGSSGYVALFEIEDQSTVTVLAMRHQREDDYRY